MPSLFGDTFDNVLRIRSSVTQNELADVKLTVAAHILATATSDNFG